MFNTHNTIQTLHVESQALYVSIVLPEFIGTN